MTPSRLTDDQRLLQETTRRFLEQTCPLAEVRRLAEAEPAGFAAPWWGRAAEMGWVGLLVPEALGGGALSGTGVVDLALVAEEVGRAVAPGPLLPTALVAGALGAADAPPQCQRWLAPLLSGRAVAAWALAEPGAWEPAGVRVRAELDGAGGYTLHGVKEPVEAGAQADVLLVTARAGDGGLVSAVVAPDAPGVTVTPLGSLDLVRRFASVAFDGTPVPAGAVLGPSDRAAVAALADELLLVGVVLQCAEMVGAVRVMFDRTVAYAFDRYSFGRPLASYQALKHRFADMAMAVEAAAAVAAGAAGALDDARAGTGDPAAATELVHAAKVYVGDHGPRVLQECVQLHGGIGVTWDHDLHLYLRRVVQDRALLGSPDDHARHVAGALGLGGAARVA